MDKFILWKLYSKFSIKFTFSNFNIFILNINFWKINKILIKIPLKVNLNWIILLYKFERYWRPALDIIINPDINLNILGIIKLWKLNILTWTKFLWQTMHIWRNITNFYSCFSYFVLVTWSILMYMATFRRKV